MKKLTAKILVVALMLPTIATTLCGCNEKAYSHDEVIEIVNSSFKTAPQLVSKSDTQKTDEGDKFTKYIFKTDKGIEFTVSSELNEDYWGFMKAEIESDYMQRMYEYLNSEILELETNNGVTFEPDFKNDGEYIELSCTTESFHDLKKIVAHLCDLYELIKDYLPDYDADTKLFPKGSPYSYYKNYHLTFDIYSTEDLLIHIPFDEKFDSYTESYILHCSQVVYAEQFRGDDFENDPYKNIPRQYIRTLYINGEKFESKKYSPCFTYDEKTHQYYGTVTYGTEMVFNGGVKDYLHREIITDYLGGSYTIHNITNTAEYKIGKDKFKAKAPDEKPELAEFYKNGKKLDNITMIVKPDFWSFDDYATYYYLMPLEDYAFMLNMDYEINQSEGAVYLTSK